MTYLPLWHLFRKGGRTLHVESMILAQLTPRRFRACLPLIFAVCLVLVASIPAVAGDSERPVHASIFVSSTESSPADRKSTRLNSSHMSISYAVFCLKKKKTTY